MRGSTAFSDPSMWSKERFSNHQNHNMFEILQTLGHGFLSRSCLIIGNKCTLVNGKIDIEKSANARTLFATRPATWLS